MGTGLTSLCPQDRKTCTSMLEGWVRRPRSVTGLLKQAHALTFRTSTAEKAVPWQTHLLIGKDH